MLKTPIRSEVKESIILLVFAGLLHETLIGPTLLIVVAGAVLVWLKQRPNKLVRNLFTLGVFGTYWLVYGKVIDPEVGLNFLTTIIVIKLLEKETERDRYMIFFGLMLIISAGSLFEKSISYVLFFAFSFFILIVDFYSNLKLSSKFKDLAAALLWVMPFTAFLFFFAPRMMNPFQIEKGELRAGEVGYTPDVNISEVESLTFNDQSVFMAKIEGKIENDRLYWRGNTLSFSDGWNWPLMPQDRIRGHFVDKQQASPGILQTIHTYMRADYYFGLDTPVSIQTPKGVAVLDHTRTLHQERLRSESKYKVVSSTQSTVNQEENLFRYRKPFLRPSEQQWVQDNFRSKSLPELQNEIQDYFNREGFSYSLTPGKIPNFMSFMTEKKIGFCSHYASAVGLILRTKGIPARLVSGFMGGNFNRYAGLYLVTQNDAHVWVEAHHKGRWRRLDPTSWIAPDRIRLGGEAFMGQEASGGFSAMGILRNRFGFLNDARQWFEQWNFRFYQWLEAMDYYGQEAWLDRISFKREWIFSFIPMVLAFFIGLYTWHLSRQKVARNRIEELWRDYLKRAKGQGLELSLYSVKESEEQIKNSQVPDKEKLIQVWDMLILSTYRPDAETNLKELKKKINQL